MNATTPRDRSSLAPCRALLHPLWIAALAVLVLNDHWLKHAGLLPEWATGKLSDLAGLMVAPLVLAVALRVRTLRGLRWAHVAVALGFGVINLWPAAARGVEAVTALGPIPWAITVDPSDLVALPMLLLSLRLFGAAAARPVEVPRRLGQLAFGAGVVASVATSPAPEPELSWQRYALAIGNDTPDQLTLRIRPLKETVFVDCDALAADPTTALSRELFAVAETWIVEPGRLVPVREEAAVAASGACYAYLVDGVVHGGSASASLEPTLLFWRSEDYPVTSSESSVAGAPADRLVRVTGGWRGAAFGAHPARYVPPALLDPTPADGCGPVPPELSVDWSLPVPEGQMMVSEIVSGRDGCHQLSLVDPGDRVHRWYVCSGVGVMPFVAGDSLYVASLSAGQNYEPVDAVELIGPDKHLTLARGADVAPWNGPGDWRADTYSECDAQHGACGSWIVPLEIRVAAGDAGIHTLAAGEHATLGDGTLLLRRADRVPVGDMACLPEAIGADGQVFESVFVKPACAGGE